jgi:hypothetical protein
LIKSLRLILKKLVNLTKVELFGFALTVGSAVHLNNMGSSQKDSLLEKLF